nr:hypothetical protein [Tanacetum cinerariifolium]
MALQYPTYHDDHLLHLYNSGSVTDGASPSGPGSVTGGSSSPSADASFTRRHTNATRRHDIHLLHTVVVVVLLLHQSMRVNKKKNNNNSKEEVDDVSAGGDGRRDKAVLVQKQRDVMNQQGRLADNCVKMQQTVLGRWKEAAEKEKASAREEAVAARESDLIEREKNLAGDL